MSDLVLLPTPVVNDMGAGKTPPQWDAWIEEMRMRHGNGNGHGRSLSIEVARNPVNWGPYEAAIRRWEGTLNREAPSPTEPGKDGRPRLSPKFVEWMMGLPDGWVCDVEGISRTQQLKILGNGVVQQQAVAAIEHLLDVVNQYATVQRIDDET